MIPGRATRDTYHTFEDVLAVRKVPKRDCRSCPKYVPDADGFDCGWCEAHKMWVKLYQVPERWYSQCQFRLIRAERAVVR